MSGFDRLTGALQYQIVNTLGWPALRPVQEQASAAILDGDNCVVLAPTAGGKTEAAFFPLLSKMTDDDWRPISVLYLSPIRALLNNQEDRVQYYAGLLGRRAFKWHGDVTGPARKKMMREPVDILLITPEAVEAMLMSPNVPARELFAGLRAVVIDEIHAFADDDRGAHLSALLERLTRHAGRDLQRIGLSATVGNPGEILRWVRGSSKRPGRVVDPGGAKNKPELALDYVGSLENAATVIRALHPGKKRLVFTDSRRQAEALGKLLDEREVLTHVIHGSLSVAQRKDAEKAFAEGENCVVVATSALELGIDVGDLDHVLQIDAPATVASFLQRMGRTGRRAHNAPNCAFLCTKEESLLQAAALLRLYEEGYVEAVEPWRRAVHIFAHQAMALAIAEGGIARDAIWPWLEGATAFADITLEERDAIVDHMLEKQILTDQDGKLWLGPVGEKKYGRANFKELYAVFESPRNIVVRYGREDIGSVDASFLQKLQEKDEPITFTLAARSWQATRIDWSRGLCEVKPAPEGRAPRWSGGARPLSYALCQAMRRVLVGDEVPAYWSQRAQKHLGAARSAHAFLRDGDDAPWVEEGEKLTWWNFAGGGANILLARMLEAELGGRAVSRNVSVTLDAAAARSSVSVRKVLAKWRAEERPTVEDAERHADGMARGRVSKFQPCLPERLEVELLREARIDVEGAVRVIGRDRLGTLD